MGKFFCNLARIGPSLLPANRKSRARAKCYNYIHNMAIPADENVMVRHDRAMKRILIIPLGTVDQDILKALSSSLEKTFHSLVERGDSVPIPPGSYDHRRKQYHSTTMLNALRDLGQGRFDRVLGVTDVDLYVPELNFVFGEADLKEGHAVISLTRLRQEFYGLSPDRELFQERAVKEAVHELGHTYGRGHCRNPACIMFFSNSLSDTNGKGPGFCASCGKAVNSRSRLRRDLFHK